MGMRRHGNGSLECIYDIASFDTFVLSNQHGQNHGEWRTRPKLQLATKVQRIIVRALFATGILVRLLYALRFPTRLD